MKANNHSTTTIKFYADDGLLTNSSATSLQFGMHEIARLFRCFGLQLNAQKTKTMISAPSPPASHISNAAYHRRITGIGLTHKE